MAKEYHHLQNLVDLAKEPSSERRRQLLREVTDLFLESPEDLSTAEVDQFSEIMGRVAFDLEMAVRRELAERLAGEGAAPSDLVSRLANDEIAVAGPILERSGVLRNADLLAIVKGRGQAHLLAVSKRQTVSEEVSDALVERGDDTVLESLAGNAGATLSRGAMEVMVTRSETDEALREPLVMRHNLPPDLMNEMFLWVSSALCAHILEANADLDEDEIDTMIAESSRSVSDKGQAPEDPEWSQPRLYIREKEAHNELSPNLVVELLRKKKVPESIVGFAHLAAPDEPTAQRIIFEAGAEALAVACKAAGFDPNAFANMMLLTSKGGVHEAGAKFELLDLYNSITERTAQWTMRFWRTRRRTQLQTVTEDAAQTLGSADADGAQI